MFFFFCNQIVVVRSTCEIRSVLCKLCLIDGGAMQINVGTVMQIMFNLPIHLGPVFFCAVDYVYYHWSCKLT